MAAAAVAAAAAQAAAAIGAPGGDGSGTVADHDPLASAAAIMALLQSHTTETISKLDRGVEDVLAVEAAGSESLPLMPPLSLPSVPLPTLPTDVLASIFTSESVSAPSSSQASSALSSSEMSELVSPVSLDPMSSANASSHVELGTGVGSACSLSSTISLPGSNPAGQSQKRAAPKPGFVQLLPQTSSKPFNLKASLSACTSPCNPSPAASPASQASHSSASTSPRRPSDPEGPQSYASSVGADFADLDDFVGNNVFHEDNTPCLSPVHVPSSPQLPQSPVFVSEDSLMTSLAFHEAQHMNSGPSSSTFRIDDILGSQGDSQSSFSTDVQTIMQTLEEQEGPEQGEPADTVFNDIADMSSPVAAGSQLEAQRSAPLAAENPDSPGVARKRTLATPVLPAAEFPTMNAKDVSGVGVASSSKSSIPGSVDSGPQQDPVTVSRCMPCIEITDSLVTLDAVEDSHCQAKAELLKAGKLEQAGSSQVSVLTSPHEQQVVSPLAPVISLHSSSAVSLPMTANTSCQTGNSKEDVAPCTAGSNKHVTSVCSVSSGSASGIAGASASVTVAEMQSKPSTSQSGRSSPISSSASQQTVIDLTAKVTVDLEGKEEQLLDNEVEAIISHSASPDSAGTLRPGTVSSLSSTSAVSSPGRRTPAEVQAEDAGSPSQLATSADLELPEAAVAAEEAGKVRSVTPSSRSSARRNKGSRYRSRTKEHTTPEPLPVSGAGSNSVNEEQQPVAAEKTVTQSDIGKHHGQPDVR